MGRFQRYFSSPVSNYSSVSKNWNRLLEKIKSSNKIVVVVVVVVVVLVVVVRMCVIHPEELTQIKDKQK